MCCFAVTHLLILGKSMISHANNVQNEDAETLKIEWPEDPTEKAKLIRGKAELMAGYVEAVSNSFITGWSTISQLTSGYNCSHMSHRVYSVARIILCRGSISFRIVDCRSNSSSTVKEYS